MSGRRSRFIRAVVYGSALSPRQREYQKHFGTGMVTAGTMRQKYQFAKLDWRRLNKE